MLIQVITIIDQKQKKSTAFWIFQGGELTITPLPPQGKQI
jgi:hypothetical protein